MAEVGLSMLDLGICLFFLFFVVVGVIRGFTSDFLGLFTWLGAALLTNRFFHYAQRLFRGWIETQFVADMLAAFVLFVISLIILVALVKFISSGVHKSILKGLDRSLGIFSGLFRGTVLLTIVYLIGLMYWKPGEKPEWMTSSKFEPYLLWTSRQAQTYVLPHDLLPPKIAQHIQHQLESVPEIPVADLVRGLSSPRPLTLEETQKAQKHKEKSKGDVKEDVSVKEEGTPTEKPPAENAPEDLILSDPRE